MIHELEQLIIDKLTPIVADVNGVEYVVSENDGSMITEIPDPEDSENVKKLLQPSVIVDYESTELEAQKARTSSPNFLQLPNTCLLYTSPSPRD